MLWAVLPGFHPGLVELALQAGIADGSSTRARVHTVTEALIFPQASPRSHPSRDREGVGDTGRRKVNPRNSFGVQVPCTFWGDIPQ